MEASKKEEFQNKIPDGFLSITEAISQDREQINTGLAFMLGL